jgi:hypothetical protein
LTSLRTSFGATDIGSDSSGNPWIF